MGTIAGMTAEYTETLLEAKLDKDALIPGDNVTIDVNPTTGDVTISATGGGSGTVPSGRMRAEATLTINNTSKTTTVTSWSFDTPTSTDAPGTPPALTAASSGHFNPTDSGWYSISAQGNATWTGTPPAFITLSLNPATTSAQGDTAQRVLTVPVDPDTGYFSIETGVIWLYGHGDDPSDGTTGILGLDVSWPTGTMATCEFWIDVVKVGGFMTGAVWANTYSTTITSPSGYPSFSDWAFFDDGIGLNTTGDHIFDVPVGLYVAQIKLDLHLATAVTDLFMSANLFSSSAFVTQELPVFCKTTGSVLGAYSVGPFPVVSPGDGAMSVSFYRGNGSSVPTITTPNCAYILTRIGDA